MGLWESAKKLWSRENKRFACGVGFLRLSRSHPFTAACKIHDIRHIQQDRGELEATRREIDTEFHKNMLKLIEKKGLGRWHKIQARAMYGIVRTLGGFWW